MVALDDLTLADFTAKVHALLFGTVVKDCWNLEKEDIVQFTKLIIKSLNDQLIY